MRDERTRHRSGAATAAPLPLTVKSKGRFKVLFDVTIGCANDPASGAGHADYRVTAHVNRAALSAIPTRIRTTTSARGA